MKVPSNMVAKDQIIQAIEDIDTQKALHVAHRLGISPPAYYRKIKMYEIDFTAIKERVKPQHRIVFSERILEKLSTDPNMRKEDVASSLFMTNSKMSERMSYYGITFWDLRRLAKARLFAGQVMQELKRNHLLSIEEVAQRLDTTVHGVQWRLSGGERNFKQLKEAAVFEKVQKLAHEGKYKTRADMASALGMHEDTLRKLLKTLGITQADIELSRMQYSEQYEDFESVSHDPVSEYEKDLVSQLIANMPNRSIYVHAMTLNITCERFQTILSALNQTAEV